MALSETVYLRKRWPEQTFWEYVKLDTVPRPPTPLQFLVTQDRVLVGPETARRVLEYFRDLGFRDDELGNIRTPIEVTDYDDKPVPLSTVLQRG